jgi:outer membrane immunogenic protein
MKQTALSFAIAALFASGGHAAELASSRTVLPPPVASPPAWGGLYLGVNAGYLAPNLASRLQSGPYYAAAMPFAALAMGQAQFANAGGAVGGAQAGFNWRLYRNFILGIEADIQGLSRGGGPGALSTLGAVVTSQNAAAVVSTSIGVSGALDYLGTARGRLGWLATPTLLVYATGGVAFGKTHANMTIVQNDGTAFPGLGDALFSGGLAGWTAGGGVEWMFWPNWSAKAEYLHYDLGVTRLLAALSPAGLVAPYIGVQSRTDFAGDLGRLGLNYHFSFRGGGPVLGPR